MLPEKSIKLSKHQALLHRLPEQHPLYQMVSDRYRRYDSGQAGETNLEYYLGQSQITSLHFLKGLRMEHDTPFQIDCLILGLGFRILLEVKNITGTIYFDPYSRQLIRQKGSTKDIFPDPLFQVERQYMHLRNFFLEHNIEQLPTYTAAVFVNRNAELQLHDYPERKRILTAQAIPSFLEKINSNHPAKISHSKNNEISSFLTNQHREAYYPILDKYAIPWEDIIKGVRCPNCHQYAMTRIRMRWQCPHCGERNATAHLEALYEQALLTDNKITNKIAREFLQISSAEVIKKILQRAPLVRVGETKGS
ncbi:nuclease-related domain-containing protein [Gracilibacillus massiliensis]|uniref:nuclease-related domain-containing protein n=1 Tax=Gracilibacillus massiliensis TaxID=1564956 RepID=UPI00071D25DB|nr:nuclease-related domain-containing protein [Gracilibacillus massiliensis]